MFVLCVWSRFWFGGVYSYGQPRTRHPTHGQHAIIIPLMHNGPTSSVFRTQLGPKYQHRTTNIEKHTQI